MVEQLDIYTEEVEEQTALAPPAPLYIVTATTRPEMARGCIESWLRTAAQPQNTHLIVVWNGSRATGWEARNVRDARLFGDTLLAAQTTILRFAAPMGTVPAFLAGVQSAQSAFVRAHGISVDTKASTNALVACFHDDLELFSYGWDTRVRAAFAQDANLGLAGFFGAKKLGRDDIYKAPYEPHQLVRERCYSNMVDGEAHGTVVQWPVRCAVLDGFSQIMRLDTATQVWQWLMGRLWIVHHAYDAAIGAWFAQKGQHCLMLPERCKHYGGRTAVGDAAYHEWARQQGKTDGTFWEEAHRNVWEWCKHRTRRTASGDQVPLLPYEVD